MNHLTLRDLPTDSLVSELRRRDFSFETALLSYKSPQLEAAVAAAAAVCSIHPQQIFEDSRRKEVFQARSLAMAILRQNGWSFMAIGKAFSLHHTTAIHAISVHRKNIRRDSSYETKAIAALCMFRDGFKF